jgi:glycosyltransferase involved in cell wall biosynthesis
MMRVAMLVPGSLGDPSTRYHVPAQVDLVRELSQTIAVRAFSLTKIDGGDRPFSLGSANVQFVRARWNDSLLLRIRRLVGACVRAHRTTPFDLVHGFWMIPAGIAAIIAGRLLRIPSVINVEGGEGARLPDIGYGALLRRSTRWTTLSGIRQADAVITLSQFQRDALIRAGAYPDKLSLIPYGASSVFSGIFAEKACAPPYRFLHVSNLAPVKDQRTLLAAFQRIRQDVPATLRIIGPDHLEGEIQHVARSLGLDDAVDFLGHVHHRELPEHFQWAQVLLHTSLYESEAVAVAEAAAAGVAVCGTGVGLIADIAPDGAVAVEPRDAEALAAQTLLLLRDTERYRKMVSRARAWAMAHEPAITGRRYSQLYSLLIAGGKKSEILHRSSSSRSRATV